MIETNLAIESCWDEEIESNIAFGRELHPVAMQVGSALYLVLLKDSRVMVRQSENEMLRSMRTNISLPFSSLVADVIRGLERVIKRT